MLVSDVLIAKGEGVWTIGMGQTLQEALHFLIAKKIGSLLILDTDEQVIGILSERDILRECNRYPTEWFKLPVHSVMNRLIQTVSPQTDLKVVMELMTENRIRHIPVMKEERLAGLVSIGDVVKAHIQHIEHENEHMRNYINGT